MRVLAVGLALCIGAISASAQTGAALDPARVVVDESGTCKRDDLARLPELGADRLVKGRGFTYVITDQPRLRTSFNRNAAETRRQPAQFDPLIIYGLDNASGSLLVGTKNLDLCGWIDPDVALYQRGAPLSDYAFGPKPVMVKNGPDGTSDTNKDNELNLKVVLQNLNKDEAPGAGSRAERGVPILPNPGISTQAQNLKTRQLFFVYEVFGWAKAKDPDDTNGQEVIYYLIGRGGDPYDKGMMDGWVHQDSVYVWTSRLASFWAKTSHAKGYAKKELLGGDQHAIVEPPSDRLREPDNRTVQRFPLIEQSPTSADLSRRVRGGGANAGQAIDRMIEHYRIATPACTRPREGSGGASTCTSDQVDQIDERKKRLRTIDVMFVMDATKSMELYFPAARAALGQFITKLSEQPNITLRAGVAIYGDYTTDEPSIRNVDYTILLPLQAVAELKKNFDVLNKVTMFTDKHGDRPEASFAALMKAAQSPYWSPAAGMRYIVHIGDHGNRELGKTSGAGSSKLVETLTEKNVADDLLAKSIIYVGIPVLGTYHAADNGAFVTQAKTIAGLMPKQAAEVRPTYMPGQPESSETRVAAVLRALTDGVQVSEEAMARVEQAINCAQNPTHTSCTRTSGTAPPGWMAQVVEGSLERTGLTADQIRRVYGQSQTVGTFYFKPRTPDGQKQVFDFYLSLEEAPFKRLARAVRDLCTNIDSSQGITVLRRAISEALDVAIDNNDNIADLFAKKLFIPAYHLNPLLLKPIEVLQEELRHAGTNGRIVAIKQGFCKSSRLLTWAEENRRILPDDRSMVWDAAQSTWKPDRDSNLKPYVWKHEGGTGVPLYYIPIEFLPREDTRSN